MRVTMESEAMVAVKLSVSMGSSVRKVSEARATSALTCWASCRKAPRGLFSVPEPLASLGRPPPPRTVEPVVAGVVGLVEKQVEETRERPVGVRIEPQLHRAHGAVPGILGHLLRLFARGPARSPR